MESLIFEDLNSSAIYSIEVNSDTVKIAFQGKKDKIYQYNCENLEEFTENLQKIVKDPLNSLGSWVNRQIKSQTLILNNTVTI